jgi:Protein of unknown function (DUF664)
LGLNGAVGCKRKGKALNSADLLVDSFGRIKEAVHAAVSGLTPADLEVRLDADANSIAWLVWHLTRIQDDHVSDVADLEQTYTASGWAKRFDLPLDVSDSGYGHTSAQVGSVRADVDKLLGYYDATHEATIAFLVGISDSDLDRVVDTRWDPPVTLGVRLVSVVADDLQHVGQAAFIRGILERR